MPAFILKIVYDEYDLSKEELGLLREKCVLLKVQSTQGVSIQLCTTQVENDSIRMSSRCTLTIPQCIKKFHF